MRKILLICSAGMSTSILVKRIIKAAELENYQVEVEAQSITKVYRIGKEWDVILLGPQVKYQLNDIRNYFPNKPIDVIEMKTYGMMDGNKILNQAKELLGD